jgi:hypothetical protein
MQRELDILRLMRSGCADHSCFSPYFVGTMERFLMLAHVVDLDGFAVCKHTNGELGIAVPAFHHLLLTIPKEGHQQTASLMAGDVVKSRLPITDGPNGEL